MGYFRKETFATSIWGLNCPHHQQVFLNTTFFNLYHFLTSILGSTLIIPILSRTLLTSSVVFPPCFNPWHSSHRFSSSIEQAPESFNFVPSTSSSINTINQQQQLVMFAQSLENYSKSATKLWKICLGFKIKLFDTEQQIIERTTAKNSTF